MTAWTTALVSILIGAGPADPETVLRVDASRVIHRVSPLLYGACIEDVNHEIYGGLYSQMIFGEGFQEPPRPVPPEGFTAYGRSWRVRDGEVSVEPGDGPKLVLDRSAIADGTIGVEVFFPGDGPGNAGLILKVDRPGEGADAFTGYEVSLETSGHLVIGRHRRNWEPLRRIPCPVPVGRWVDLVARMQGRSLDILVDGKPVASYEDVDHPLAPGRVGLRAWQRPARYRNLRVASRAIPLVPKPDAANFDGVSGMWTPIARGSANGSPTIENRDPFSGVQSQRITFVDGGGAVGVANRGLNGWGMNVVEGKPYEGYVWARADTPIELSLALEGNDGRVLAERILPVRLGGWARHDFTLSPSSSDRDARFAIKLRAPGSVVLGHAFLQPGPWGRFKGLPDRRDVVEAMLDQGITVLRYGGSMVNHPGYRWKSLIGPRDRRAPGPGTWYPYSSNGWGIFDFLDLCEAMGILGIPAINMGETPGDMADFVAYANDPPDTAWGKNRAADGHPEPYRLGHLELGNEEAVNEAYWARFRPMAEAIWAKDPAIILIVGDFAYGRVIQNPDRFEGGAVVNSLAVHRKILELARARGREVWFDIHASTDHPPEPNGLLPERSYIDWLGKLAPGANHKVVIFEYNSGNHAMKRALSNALATNEVERIGDRLPIACAANCLQPDGQNDNGWDQGLLFLNPSKVWLQPPGYLTRMTRRHFQPVLVASEVIGPLGDLSVNAKRSEDGKTLVLQVVNPSDSPRPTRIELAGFTATKATAQVETMSGPLEAANTADDPNRITPLPSEWRHGLGGGSSSYTFQARSISIIRLD